MCVSECKMKTCIFPGVVLGAISSGDYLTVGFTEIAATSSWWAVAIPSKCVLVELNPIFTVIDSAALKLCVCVCVCACILKCACIIVCACVL